MLVFHPIGRWRLAGSLVVLAALARPCPADAPAAAPPVPVHPFADLSGAVRPLHGIHLPGIAVVPLALAKGSQAGFGAHVGLRGADVVVLPLPLPAGEMHVRVSNRGDRPLEILPGDTILSPVGPSRSADRTVWIPAGAAAFVPVLHAEGPPPPGPYLSRGFGLSPIEQQRVRAGTWDERVRERNRRFGVEERRWTDASAAYVADDFEAAAEPYRKALGELSRNGEVVGVLVADARGIFFGRLGSDAHRFAEAWPWLLAGIALDGTMAGAGTAAPEERLLQQEARRLLDALASGALLSRATFGLGTEHRVALADGTGAWEGLAITGRPVTLTLLRDVPTPQATPPTPPPPENPPPPVPGVVDRKPRPSEFEERWRDRR